MQARLGLGWRILPRNGRTRVLGRPLFIQPWPWKSHRNDSGQGEYDHSDAPDEGGCSYGLKTGPKWVRLVIGIDAAAITVANDIA